MHQTSGRPGKRSIHGYVSIYRRPATQPLGLRWGFETTSNQLAGRVAERLKAAASKAVEGLLALREFESHPFRQIKLLHNLIWLPQLPLRPKIGLFPFLYLNFGTKFR
jgi:hypothetical protein